MIGTAIVLAAAMQGTPATIRLDEVSVLVGKPALSLAPRILPPDIARRVTEGRVSRRFLPGQVWQAWFPGEPVPSERDLCKRIAYAVELGAPSASGGDAPGDTPLTIGEVEEVRGVAVLPAGTRASAESCRRAAYVGIGGQPARTVAAYRVLVAAMAAAQADRLALPFAVSCRSENPAACTDGRRALAQLPLDALSHIAVTCLDTESRREVTGAVAIVTCPPLRPGATYKAEVRFGMSGDDGQSWSLEFEHRPGWPAEMRLARSTIIYH